MSSAEDGMGARFVFDLHPDGLGKSGASFIADPDLGFITSSELGFTLCAMEYFKELKWRYPVLLAPPFPMLGRGDVCRALFTQASNSIRTGAEYVVAQVQLVERNFAQYVFHPESAVGTDITLLPGCPLVRVDGLRFKPIGINLAVPQLQPTDKALYMDVLNGRNDRRAAHQVNCMFRGKRDAPLAGTCILTTAVYEHVQARLGSGASLATRFPTPPHNRPIKTLTWTNPPDGLGVGHLWTKTTASVNFSEHAQLLNPPTAEGMKPAILQVPGHLDDEDLRAWLRENDGTIFVQLNRKERNIKLCALKAATDLISMRYHFSAVAGQKIREYYQKKFDDAAAVPAVLDVLRDICPLPMAEQKLEFLGSVRNHRVNASSSLYPPAKYESGMEFDWELGYWCLQVLIALIDQAPVLASRVVNSGGCEVALTLARVCLLKPAGGYVQIAISAIQLLNHILSQVIVEVPITAGEEEDFANRTLEKVGKEPLGGLDVKHKAGTRWLLDGVMPTHNSNSRARYAKLQAGIPKRDQAFILQRLGEAGACELLIDLFPVLPSAEAALSAVKLFDALLSIPTNCLRINCKGVVSRVQSVQNTFRTSQECFEFIENTLLPKMQGSAELETTRLGVEHARSPALKGKPWMEETVLLGQVALPQKSTASPFRQTFGWSQHLQYGAFQDKRYQDKVRLARDEVMRSTVGSGLSSTYSSGFGLGKARSSPDLAETLTDFPRMRPDGWQKSWMDYARPQPTSYLRAYKTASTTAATYRS